MKRLAIAAAFALLFAGQAAPSIMIAWEHSKRLSDGRELVLAVETRDPRDLFRGEYSVLTYEVGRPRNLETAIAGLADRCDLSQDRPCSIRSGTPVFVVLQPDENGIHRAVQVVFEPPPGGAPFIAGKVASANIVKAGASLGRANERCERAACFNGLITYGIENWFGPQGVPAQVDRIDRRDIVVRVKVDSSGRATLDALVVKGQDFARTPRL